MNGSTNTPTPPPFPLASNTRVTRFFIGAGLGALFSTVVWLIAWAGFTREHTGAALLLVPLIKVAIGTALIFIPRWRSAGAGVFVSIALGMLILGARVSINHSDRDAVANTPIPPSSVSPPASSPASGVSTCKGI